ncbi:precorrin-3B C(17)-methyltransferase [Gudongella sp. SC589]|uniref:precorrin-3B C(17)-methyltransferase n=1 Tax=Gudongella sp. SC589 TaxID=3385990 RepID=UPI003904C97C
MSKLYVVGIGPGGLEHMTYRAVDVLRSCDAVVGYNGYLKYVEDFIGGKEVYSTGMRAELDRCRMAVEFVRRGKDTAIISTGDAGLYGMAGPILEMSGDVEVEIVPGVSSCFSAAADLGSPIMHDFATISLSDLLTPWEAIEKRLRLAAQGDFVISIYNPRSKGRPDYLKRAVDIILEFRDEGTPVGLVKNSGREGTEKMVWTLGKMDYEAVDMMSVLIIGNSNTYIRDNLIITPRGYDIL